jgi:putative ABC transport system permease protein
MQMLWQDLRFGLRVLLRNPVLSVIAMLALALGIGANTAIFSVVNAVLLRPLPYHEPERLVYLFRSQPPIERSPVSPPAFRDFTEQQNTVEPLAAHFGETYNLTGVDESERLIGRRVTGNFFALFGLQPERGRWLTAADDQPDGAQVAVISYGLWQRRFGGAPEIIGKTVSLNSVAHTIVGVAPASFQFPRRVEVWTPARLAEERRGRGNNFLMMVGRLKNGVTRAEAHAQFNQIAGRLARQYPQNHGKLSIAVTPLLEEQVRNVRNVLWIMLGAVGFVLLIACANVANLLLARAAARQKEFALRAALGAGAWRIVRQLLTESSLLALAGAGLGVLLAFAGIRALVALAPANLPRADDVRMDGWVLGFTLLTAVLTGVLSGLAPALRFARANLNDTLKEGARGAMGGPSQSWLWRGLVVSEIAMSLVLLVSAGLLIGSMRRLLAVNPGFDPRPLLTADISYPRGVYAADAAGQRREIQARAAFLRAAEEKAASLPGVLAVGVINDLPVTGASSVNGGFQIEGQPPVNTGDGPLAERKFITPDYFAAMGIAVRQGRAFTARDMLDAPPVVLINEAMAQQYFPNRDALGKRLTVMDNAPREIVGIVGDARQFGLQRPASPEIYFPNAQIPYGDTVALVARTSAAPASLSDALRRALQSVNADAPVFRVRTMTDVLDAATAADRFNMILMTVFAALALLMAAIGLYGVLSYAVSQNTREFGIRMALGAQPGDVLKLVLSHGMVLAVTGVALGLAAAYGLTRLMTSFLFGIGARDPWTFAALAALLTAVTLLACYFPARRATRVDPLTALRHE